MRKYFSNKQSLVPRMPKGKRELVLTETEVKVYIDRRIRDWGSMWWGWRVNQEPYYMGLFQGIVKIGSRINNWE